MRLPCIVCEDGDIYSNIVCENCECSIDLRTETYQSMVSLVLDINRKMGNIPHDLSEELHREVKKVYDLLCQIKIK